MKTFYFLIATMFITSVSFGQTSQLSKDKILVRKVVTDFQDDFNEGSFKNVNSYTTKDWEHLNPSGGITVGRENVLKEVRAVHQTFLKGVTMKMESIAIRFITNTVAIADAVHKIDTYTTPNGKQHVNERHIKTYVIVKQKGKWLLTQDQNTIIAN